MILIDARVENRDDLAGTGVAGCPGGRRTDQGGALRERDPLQLILVDGRDLGHCTQLFEPRRIHLQSQKRDGRESLDRGGSDVRKPIEDRSLRLRNRPSLLQHGGSSGKTPLRLKPHAQTDDHAHAALLLSPFQQLPEIFAPRASSAKPLLRRRRGAFRRRLLSLLRLSLLLRRRPLSPARKEQREKEHRNEAARQAAPGSAEIGKASERASH